MALVASAVILGISIAGLALAALLTGTGVAGLDRTAADELRQRGFQVVTESTRRDGGINDQVAVIRYGPRTVGAATAVRALFYDQAGTEFDIRRTDDLVDVILGVRFDHLVTITEVNQTLAALGQPTAPPGTCAEPPR